jgi:hypothetical protein
MIGQFERLRLFAGFALVALAAAIAGCNNGTSNSGPVVTPTATPTATPTPFPSGTTKGNASCTSGAAPATTTAPVAAGANTLTFPTVGGCSMTISVSGASGTATTATLTTQLTAPAGLATPLATTGPGGPPTGFTLPYTPVFYTILSFNGTISITTSPKYVYQVPTITPGNNFFSVSWQNSGGTSNFNAYGADCNNNALALTITGTALTLPGGCAQNGGALPAGSQLVTALAYF